MFGTALTCCTLTRLRVYVAQAVAATYVSCRYESLAQKDIGLYYHILCPLLRKEAARTVCPLVSSSQNIDATLLSNSSTYRKISLALFSLYILKTEPIELFEILKPPRPEELFDDMCATILKRRYPAELRISCATLFSRSVSHVVACKDPNDCIQADRRPARCWPKINTTRPDLQRFL